MIKETLYSKRIHLIHSHSLLNYGVTKIFFIVERPQVGKTIHRGVGVRSGSSERPHLRQDGVKPVGKGVGGQRGRQEARDGQEEEEERAQ